MRARRGGQFADFIEAMRYPLIRRLILFPMVTMTSGLLILFAGWILRVTLNPITRPDYDWKLGLVFAGLWLLGLIIGIVGGVKLKRGVSKLNRILEAIEREETSGS